MKERIVLAYSGGLDTSAAIPWLVQNHGAEVSTITLDLGQGKELDQIRGRALASGAARAHVLDVREEFARDYILPALQAGALYAGRYPMTASLARPLIAKKLVEIAHIEGVTVVAHGAAGRGNDLLPLDLSIRALDPGLRVVAPARASGMSRAQAREYARGRGVGLPATVEATYRIDANLWGRSIECGVLDDPWQEPPDEIYTLTKAAAQAPAAPAYVDISWNRGVPQAVNGVAMSFTELIESLTTIAGGHGIGRIDTIENRQAGIVSREISEAPAAVVLHAAHRELETFVLARDLERLKRELSLKYADLVYNGLWFTPMREALDAFNRTVQEQVTGTVRLRLYKGNCEVVGRKAASVAPPARQVASYAQEPVTRGL
jgi:argininosuccinate synthase